MSSLTCAGRNARSEGPQMKLRFLICEPVRDVMELGARMEQLAALGYQGVELTAKHPFDYPLAEVAALAQRFDLPIVSLVSGWSYLHEGLCLCSPSAEVRSRAVERLKDYVDAAAQLRALLVVGLMQGLRSDEPNGELAAARIRDCLDEVAQRAAESQVNDVIAPG